MATAAMSQSGSGAGAFAVLAAGPAARSALALFQLLLGAADTAFSCFGLLGILDPADELVAGQRGEACPDVEDRTIGDEYLPKIFGKLVHHPAHNFGSPGLAGSTHPSDRWVKSCLTLLYHFIPLRGCRHRPLIARKAAS